MDEHLTNLDARAKTRSNQDSISLRLARYRYVFHMRDDLPLPRYAGSLLRGQLGAHLRQISCLTQAASCNGCPLRSTCPYPTMFESPAPDHHPMQQFSQIPNPYVVEPPPIGTLHVPRGSELAFNVVLIGKAVDQLALISHALRAALDKGLGPSHARGVLQRIDVQNSLEAEPLSWLTIWHKGDATFRAHADVVSATRWPIHEDSPESIRLVFETPLRLQHQGRPLKPEALTPRKLVADLLRRASLLAEFHADQPGFVPDVGALVRQASTLDHDHDLRWYDWARYSSRQRQEMTLGGAIGTWKLSGSLAPLLPWLEIGQWLHLGKNATLGLGRYRLETAQEPGQA